MVMILTKTRQNKGADSVTCRTELHTPKMSQGPTLFSCGVMENDRWRDLSRKCPLQLEQPGASIWDCLSDKGEEGSRWPRDTATTCSVTNLIKDLSLSDPHGNPSAPPASASAARSPFRMRCPVVAPPGDLWAPRSGRRWRSGGVTAGAACSATPTASPPCRGARASASRRGPTRCAASIPPSAAGWDASRGDQPPAGMGWTCRGPCPALTTTSPPRSTVCHRRAALLPPHRSWADGQGGSPGAAPSLAS